MAKLLNYQQSGSGKNIILIHGLFGRLENLNMVAKALAENYRVTSVDVRNHGDSFHDSVMNYSTMAQDIIDIMQHLAINSAVVLGHSMGGKIAMELALTAPALVEKLIVADIAPAEYPPHHKQIIAGLRSLDFTMIKQRKDADKQLSQYVDNLSVRQFLLRNLSSENGQFSFKCNLENIAKNYPQIMTAYQGSNSYQGPTLFIKGANSNYILPEHRTVILRLFPQSRARIIQGAGHWLHAEKTLAFNRSVEGFLTN
ncbi:alpha/beta fold hydrolase [Colwellia sp. MB02u-10]|uniref:alpha/beta fold hydrolase n=1 Tax=Colwellia sp. MB02u-10 TaxID=2759828 RepID=UPI0015F53A50|nr:alpha/beta fold hydrolase [Colwellia sp. MB02u-10]MBA6341019.1 alpha/beta fold hydrolase [Colwellia sp. MB02u-10]